MAEKKTTKTTRTKKVEEGGLSGILLASVIRGIQSFIDGALENVHQMMHRFTAKLIRRTFLFCFAFVGIIFLLVGLARLLSALYRIPGSGETIMGLFILLISLLIFVFDRDQRS